MAHQTSLKIAPYAFQNLYILHDDRRKVNKYILKRAE